MVDMHLVRGLSVKRLIPSGLGVEHQIAHQVLRHSSHRFVGVRIHLLVCDAFPESFRKHVIPPVACAVHADLNTVIGEKSCELVAGELAPLVGVENLGAAILRDRLLHCLEAEVRGQRIGESPHRWNSMPTWALIHPLPLELETSPCELI